MERKYDLEKVEPSTTEMKEYEIHFPGGWCYIMADHIVSIKETGQMVFKIGSKIVGVIRLDNKGMLVTGHEIEAE